MTNPRNIAKPEPGYWLMRLVKNGAPVPAAIVRVETKAEPGNPTNLMTRSPFLVGYIDGKIVSPYEVWERSGKEIDKSEYDFLVKDSYWAKHFATNEPKANPHQAVDLTKLPAITP